ncbi:MAG: cyclic nucleotide-binding domain-containing protein [Verrucomicrobiales bacterium]|nr:cyclic nucleotide-binding domain-containing protein [Verrucomicrobiales bacterium]
MSAESTQPELPAMGFVQELDADERSALGAYGQFVDAKDGDTIIAEGQDQDSLFLVIMGSFHVQTEATGRPVLLGQLKAGDTIGEINIFDPGTASARVVSKSISQIWKIDRASLEQFLEANPEAAARLLVSVATQLSKRLRKTNEKVAMAREAMMGSY